MAVHPILKRRARITSKGWFVLWGTYLTGITSTPISEIWVGPFKTMTDGLRSIHG